MYSSTIMNEFSHLTFHTSTTGTCMALQRSQVKCWYV